MHGLQVRLLAEGDIGGVFAFISIQMNEAV
jgi:hypothetical protein